MRRSSLVYLWFFAATPLLAQQAHETVSLDSGAVVRLIWSDGSEKARLLAPFRWDSALVRYCRYPSPVCGGSTLNPARSRPVNELTGLEVRHGSHTARGALIGAGFGVLGGVLVLQARGLGDAPRLNANQQLLTVAVLAAAWSGIGALVGAASDNWQVVPW